MPEIQLHSLRWLAAGLLLLPATPAGCQSSSGSTEDTAATAQAAETTQPADTGTAGSPHPEADLFMEAARDAWRAVVRNTEKTGLISATPHYDFATTWDIGSSIAALYSAHELGIIERDDYDERMEDLLSAIEDLPLYEGAAYHKIYSTTTGRMAENSKPSRTGYAWSATDLGRFLLWLRIIAEDEEYREDAQDIVARMDLTRMVKDGYLYGHGKNRRAKYFLEGRIGYEQYAALGFAAWGQRAEKALNVMTNAQPLEVMGVELLKDGRGLDRLVSEPFVMMGLEVGWDPDYRKLAEAMLAVQEARYRETGQVTIVSEDAVSVPPYYFYYYCVYCNGKEFVVDVDDPGKELSGPRWVSTKNAFGWHALLPGEYTGLAVTEVEPARSDGGWSSGVFEKTGESTRMEDINTAAVILEAALYAKRARPFIDRETLLTPPG